MSGLAESQQAKDEEIKALREAAALREAEVATQSAPKQLKMTQQVQA